jgi:predicted ABC-type transport system involved in lysophospholipase L1 biosynthesis ATPase subunit
VARLASECGIEPAILPRPLAAAGPAARVRVRLARALALDPLVLLAEHPNAPLDRPEAARLAADLSAVAGGRNLAMLVLTADAAFAAALGARVMTFAPATGRLVPPGWRAWLSRYWLPGASRLRG